MKKHKLIIICLIVAIILAGSLFLLSDKTKEEKKRSFSEITPKETSSVVSEETPEITSETVDTEIKPIEKTEEVEKLSEDYFNIQTNSTFTYSDGVLTGYVANASENVLKCRIQICTEDEVLYESGIVPPESYIETFPLSRNLEEEPYVFVTYKIYNDNGELLNNIPVKVKVNY